MRERDFQIGRSPRWSIVAKRICPRGGQTGVLQKRLSSCHPIAARQWTPTGTPPDSVRRCHNRCLIAGRHPRCFDNSIRLFSTLQKTTSNCGYYVNRNKLLLRIRQSNQLLGPCKSVSFDGSPVRLRGISFDGGLITIFSFVDILIAYPNL